MNALLTDYKSFRTAGMSAQQALRAAKIEAEWRKLWFDGVVSLIAVEDDEPYDPGDCELTDSDWDRINQLGVWGTVGRYSIQPLEADESDGWIVADDCWGHAGYQNVLDPRENWYVTDIKAETISRYHKAVEEAYSCYKIA